jgi:hypothetical protein
MFAASVPRRGEKTKVKAPSYPTCSTTSRVSAKSASVSPGKPTMMSVVNVTPGIAARSPARMSR